MSSGPACFRRGLPPVGARDMLRAVPPPGALMSPLRTIPLITRVIVGLLVAGPLAAQKAKRTPARPDSTRAARDASDPALRALHWRLVGPFRGGRAVAVAGDPTRPLVFYFGAADGGVWKTANGGETWGKVTQGPADNAPGGAIAVPPSHPHAVFVGAGGDALRREPAVRRGRGDLRR